MRKQDDRTTYAQAILIGVLGTSEISGGVEGSWHDVCRSNHVQGTPKNKHLLGNGSLKTTTQVKLRSSAMASYPMCHFRPDILTCMRPSPFDPQTAWLFGKPSSVAEWFCNLLDVAMFNCG